MGKRSNFKRSPRDFYPTPYEAVVPLLPHLDYGAEFIEPCAGDGTLVRHLESNGHRCVWAGDIEPQGERIERRDALSAPFPPSVKHSVIITNPPWSRDVLHQMIERFLYLRPTWLLFDADWMHTKQSSPYMDYCRRIISVGRVKWIPDSKMTGKDNCAWYLFTRDIIRPTEFWGRKA